jgi:hypothetical protein
MCNHINKPKPASYKEALMHEIYCSEIEQEGIDTVVGTADVIEELNDETNGKVEEVPSIGFCSFCMESGQYMNKCECRGIFNLEPNVDAFYSEGEEDESIKEVESDDEDDNPPPLKERNPSGSTAGYNSDDEDEDEVILIEMRRGDIQESQTPKLYTHGVPMWGWCNICGRAGYYALACSCQGHYTEEINPRIYDANQSDDQDNILEFMYRITKKKNTNEEVHHVQANYSTDTTEEFLGDTGATTHIVNKINGMTKISRDNLGQMKVGNGELTSVVAKGTLTMKTKEGHEVRLNNTHVVPNITKNIISITQLLHEGWKLGGTKKEMFLNKGQKSIMFTAKEKNPYYSQLKRTEDDMNEVNTVNTCPVTKSLGKIQFWGYSTRSCIISAKFAAGKL